MKQFKGENFDSKFIKKKNNSLWKDNRSNVS